MSQIKNAIFRGNFVLVFFASLLMFTAFYILLPTLPVFLTRELKIDEAQTGLILAVYTLAALLIRPFTGFMIDRHGRKMFYITSLLLFALMFAGYPLAGAFAVILAVRFAHGLVWGVATTPAAPLLSISCRPSAGAKALGCTGLP
jgi:MFS family permease